MKQQCLLLLIALTMASCSVVFKGSSQRTSIDSALVGSWYGKESNQQWIGVEKHWIQYRFEDGTFVLLFLNLEKCSVDPSTERGIWWVENGVFHEKFESGRTDSYDYEMISSSMVVFKAKKLESTGQNPSYNFIEQKVE